MPASETGARQMLAEVVKVTPTTAPMSSRFAADLEIPSADVDDLFITCGYVEADTDERPLSNVYIYLYSTFRRELEADGPISASGIEMEEDLLVQAVKLELPPIARTAISDEAVFHLVTPTATREVTVEP